MYEQPAEAGVRKEDAGEIGAICRKRLTGNTPPVCPKIEWIWHRFHAF
jgi:hypothetical protein